jgi:20S proteasome alpha/beta subunit
MGLKAIARMIQTMLYAKRFFPYYVYNILGGIEEDGELVLAFSSAQADSQEPVRSTRMTLLEVMSEKHAEQLVPLNLYFNPSSTIR